MHELKIFIRRAEVRALYRSSFRAATRYVRARPDGRDVLEQVRDACRRGAAKTSDAAAFPSTRPVGRRRYRRHRDESDDFSIKQLIASGRSALREVTALAEPEDLGDSDPGDYEVGRDWPWAAAAPPRPAGGPLGWPKR